MDRAEYDAWMARADALIATLKADAAAPVPSAPVPLAPSRERAALVRIALLCQTLWRLQALSPLAQHVVLDIAAECRRVLERETRE